MAPAFDVGVNISEAVSDIEEIEGDIAVARGRLQQEMDDAVRETADDFRDEVIRQIKASEIERDTGELLNSWRVRPRGTARYEVRSTADHAIFLELGTRGHPIEGNPFLYFEPEPGTIDEYPDRYVTDDGMILIDEVDHPGNDEYEYFRDAYRAKDWKDILRQRLEDAADDAFGDLGVGGR